MSVRPKSILRKRTDTFVADISAADLLKFGQPIQETRVRVQATQEHVHLLIADSFGTRIHQFFDTKPFDSTDTSLWIPPHQNENHDYIRVRNYCKGGRRLADGIQDQELADIVEFQPKSILIMLGMVDIASQQKGNISIDKNGWFFETMISVVRSAKEKLYELVGEENEEDLFYVNNLVFHFAHLPPWGTAYTPRPGCITPQEVKALRKRNQQTATRHIGELVENDIMLVNLNVNEPIREQDGLHYDKETSEKLFKRVKTFFFRFVCRECGFFKKKKTSNYAQESEDLIFAPSCEFDIKSEEGLDRQQPN